MARRRPPDPYPPGWEPFLTAISAVPDDDTPRLVFADWLDENGDPDRSAFIRAQVALSRAAEYDPGGEWGLSGLAQDLSALHDRQAALLAANRTRWMTEYPAWVCHGFVTFRRGFVDRVTAAPVDWFRDGERLRGLAAVAGVSLILTGGCPADFLGLPSLRGLSELALIDLPTWLAAQVADSAILEGLATLTLGGDQYRHVELPTVRRLLSSPRLAGLRRLTVADLEVGTTAGFVVASSPHLWNLERVTFWQTGAGSDAVAELLNSPNLANVTRLALPANRIADGGVRPLLTTPYTRSIHELSLVGNELSGYGGRLIAGWPGLRHVRRLNLGNNRLGAAGVRAVLESPSAEAFDDLNLATNGLSASEKRELAGSSRLRPVARLNW